ncbi:MAG: HAD family hydrolase [Candidatus Pacearchaeota archaeon]
MIKSIIFDLGGVLFSSDGGTYEARERLASELNIDAKKLHAIWFSRKERLLKGLMAEEDYLGELIKSFNLDISLESLKNIIKGYNKINPEMVALVKSLRNKYNLFALTNEVKEWHEYRIKTFQLKDYFNKIICSSEVGLMKPQNEIYELCLKLIGAEPSNCLFIDDRVENLKSPQDLGMQIIHFKNRLDLIEEMSKLGISFSDY